MRDVTTSYRIALLSHEDRYVDVLEKHFQRLGHTTKLIRYSDTTPREQIVEELKIFEPQICHFRNFYAMSPIPEVQDPVFEWIQKRQIPCAVWYIDHPEVTGNQRLNFWWYEGLGLPNFLFLCMDRSHVEFFRERGFASAYLPFSVDDDLFNSTPPPYSKSLLPVSFVGRPFEFQTIHKPALEELRPLVLREALMRFWPAIEGNLKALVPQFDEKAPRVQSLLSQLYLQKTYSGEAYAKLRHELFTSIESLMEHPGAQLFMKSLRGYFDFTVSYCAMAELLDAAIDQGLHLFGGPGWNSLLARYASPSVQIAPEEAYQVFHQAQVNLCLTKLPFTTAVHDRVFLTYALKGFPLMDRRADLFELFETGEVDSFEGPEELRSKIKFYLGNSVAREAIMQKGFARTQKAHTHSIRLKRMLEIIQQHFSI